MTNLSQKLTHHRQQKLEPKYLPESLAQPISSEKPYIFILSYIHMVITFVHNFKIMLCKYLKKKCKTFCADFQEGKHCKTKCAGNLQQPRKITCFGSGRRKLTFSFVTPDFCFLAGLFFGRTFVFWPDCCFLAGLCFARTSVWPDCFLPGPVFGRTTGPS